LISVGLPFTIQRQQTHRPTTRYGYSLRLGLARRHARLEDDLWLRRRIPAHIRLDVRRPAHGGANSDRRRGDRCCGSCSRRSGAWSWLCMLRLFAGESQRGVYHVGRCFSRSGRVGILCWCWLGEDRWWSFGGLCEYFLGRHGCDLRDRGADRLEEEEDEKFRNTSRARSRKEGFTSAAEWVVATACFSSSRSSATRLLSAWLPLSLTYDRNVERMNP
jgi:hypothetical protein